MVFVKNVKLCEAECAEHITHFAKEIVDYRKQTVCDVVGKFGGIYIEVKEHTTEQEIIEFYRKSLQ